MLERISMNPKICHGKPCIRGTRLPIYVILDALASGMNYEEIKQEYPPVTDKDIRAVVSYAARFTEEETKGKIATG